MNVIVGIDGHPQKADAIALGADLARLGGGRLIVATVYTWSPYAVRLGNAYAVTVTDDAEELLTEATSALEPGSFETRAVGAMSAPRALHDLAEEEHADLIVIGSPHHGPVGRTLLGSTSQRVIEGAPVPVAIAPHGYAGHEAPKRIGVGYDASPEAREALAWATRTAGSLGATITVFYVHEPLNLVAYPGAANPHDDLDRTMREESQAALDEAVAGLPDELSPSGVLLEAPVAHALADAAEAVDLLVIGSRGYGPRRAVLMGSAAHGLSHRAPCPLIVLPRSAAAGESERGEAAASSTA